MVCHIPENVEVYLEVTMNDPVAYRDNLTPRHLRMCRNQLIR